MAEEVQRSAAHADSTPSARSSEAAWALPIDLPRRRIQLGEVLLGQTGQRDHVALALEDEVRQAQEEDDEST